MKIKLQFLGIIFTLCLAAIQLDKNHVPNQQIIVEFSDEKLQNKSEIINTLTEDLRNLGISNVSMKKQESGKLLLTYFSHIDVVDLEKTINKSLDNDISFSKDGKSDDNSENQKVKFKIEHLDKKGFPIKGFSGTLVETSLKSNRLDPNIFDYNISGFSQNTENIIFINSNQNKNSHDIFIIELLKFKLPEVRAGPFSIG